MVVGDYILMTLFLKFHNVTYSFSAISTQFSPAQAKSGKQWNEQMVVNKS